MSIMVKEVLKMAETALEQAGCMDPKLDAEGLFKFQHKLDNTGLFLMKPKMIDQKEFEKYFELVDIRAEGVPLQYITGSQEFMGLKFKVNEDVLIPRQDTETLVETALEYIIGKDPSKKIKHKGELKILDLCCGSGAIGISVFNYSKKENKKVKVTCADISEKAINIAKENGKLLQTGKGVDFICGDLLKPFKRKFSNKKFNMILSNPPYIKSEIIPLLQREVKDHEPMLALDGGEDGLNFYWDIINESKDYLAKDGILILEIGYDQADGIKNICDKVGKCKSLEILKDLPGHDRVAVIKF